MNAARRSAEALSAALASGLLVLLGGPRCALALEGPGDTQALPCRPTIACTAELTRPGAFELEAGALYRHLEHGLEQLSLPFLGKLTLASWAQLQLGSNGLTREHGPLAVSYFDNVTAGLKLHFVDQLGLVPAVSASFTVSVPSGSQVGFASEDAVLMTVYVTKDFGPLHADFNVGLNRFDVDASPTSQAWVALSLSTNLPAHFGLAVENYGFTPAEPFASHDGGALFALTYAPASWVVFDGGLDVGYFSSRSLSAFLGLTVVPVRLWQPS